MKTLAWDTSTAPSAVALLDGSDPVASSVAASEGRHGEVLLPRVEGLLGEAGWHKRDVELLAVGLGPGSFTGLRVGLAAAKGWAVAMGLPLVGVPSHAAIAGALRAAGQAAPDGALVVVTDAFKGEVYVSVFGPGDDPLEAAAPGRTFHDGPELATARIAGAVGLAPLTFAGDGLRRYFEVFSTAFGARARWADAAFDVPCPVTLGRLAYLQWERCGPGDARGLEPIYVRGSDARLPERPLSL